MLNYMAAQKQKKYFFNLSKAEVVLWSVSVFTILLSFCLFDKENFLTLIASLIGVTSLIFNAKGNPFGQFLMVLFSLLYGIISFSFAYYGEMITYLGMTMPMSIFALISWLKNPYNGNKSIVLIILWILASIYDAKYISVVVCFVAFLVNDIYGFVNWCKMKKRQNNN